MEIPLYGDDWAERALALVQARHRPQNVQRVPATTRGDAGLDCFTVDKPECVYQFYGPREPLASGDRTKKIAAKLQIDTGKFINNRQKIAPVLKGRRIERWCLFVPRYDDKKLVADCGTAAQRIQTASLPYVASTIEVLIWDQEDFASEIKEMRRRSALTPSLAIASVPQTSIFDWQQEKPHLAETMHRKMRRAYPNASKQQLSEKLDGLIRALLEGQNLGDRIREEMPSEAEELLKYVQSREKILSAIGAGNSHPSDRLFAELEDVRNRAASIAHISQSDAQQYAFGLVADWIARCPLDW